jgi:hypothetical protein
MRRHAAAFFAVATTAGFDLQPDEDLDWLTRHGHLQPTVTAKLPSHALKAIEAIFAELGGDDDALRAKTRGRMDADFLLQPGTWHVEYDEHSHFTTSRRATFAHYPTAVPLGYDVEAYQELCELYEQRGNKGFAHKTAREFPGPLGRARQRAYFDAFRDLAAPARVLSGRQDLHLRPPVPQQAEAIQAGDTLALSSQSRQPRSRPGRST